MTEEAFAETALVVMVNVADVLPAGTATETGTCAADVLLLNSVTAAPLAGAAPLSVTVPVELLPPTTEVGFSVSDDKLAAFTVSVALCEAPSIPEIVADVLAATGLVVTANVADVLPPGTVTEAGTCAADVLLL